MALRKERVVQRLVDLREQNSLTQEQAAQKVGVTHRQWQRWEAGESMPYPRNLDLIATRFGITVAGFFDDEDESPAVLPLPTNLAEELAEIRQFLESLDQKVSRLLQIRESQATDPEAALAGVFQQLAEAARRDLAAELDETRRTQSEPPAS
jgi:transcriptional regulator with XRE-family HTH domain